MTDKQKSILAMLIATLGFALMGVFIKLTGPIPVIQKVAFRSYIILLTVYIMMRKAGISLKSITRWKLLSLRSLMGTLGISLNYYAIDKLVLSDADVIYRLSTFFILLFSWIFLGEKISMKQFLTILTAFIGMLFIVKPQFNVELIPYLAALTGTILAAGAHTIVRAVGKDVPPLATVFFYAAFTCLVLTPLTVYYYQAMTLKQVIYVILTGLAASVGQVGIAYAYKHAPAKEVSIYSYFGLIFATVFSVLIFDTVPDPYSFIGYSIILAAGYYMYKLNLKAESLYTKATVD